ncbi:wax ester synthase/diacylglycerol acyltransferase 5-like isoform X2 [Quercus robur]|uniref:wax ester synthase/diacylglycerol acyltransferase 5-like isoform X2 n=1 Tax=Quercus robur TaxID=38942 RepID=UPI002161BABE|nr:wax ester synthase/diacylglycerol acyltransferase 5-like isoform X2 [Quercus robur]
MGESDNNGKVSREEEEQPLSPAARLFHSPSFNCYIIAILGCNTKFKPDVIKSGLEQTLLKHPRFSSKLVADDGQRWTKTIVNLEDHVIVPDLDPNIDFADQFVEDYISDLTTKPMDLSKPLWELHLLNIKTSDAEAVGVFRIHHSMGDGASLISLLLACTRKTLDPEALPSVPENIQAGSTNSGGFWWFLSAFWSVLRLIWNTLVDVLLFGVTIMFMKDTKTPIKGAPGVEHNIKKFVHRTISLDDIKLVKNALNMTVNDVVLGVTQAGLSRYLNRRYAGEAEIDGGEKQRKSNLPKSIRLRATILVNQRPTVGIQALANMMEKGSKTRWGNLIGYILLPFTIALQDDPLDYVRTAKATIDRKKHSLESICTFSGGVLVLRTFGVKVAAALMHKVLSNTTMAFSSMVGPLEEISFYGHPLAYIAPSVYGHPHALTIHYQSYVNKMTIALAVDPNAIPDPHQLCDELEESLKLIHDAIVKKV